MSFLLRIVTWNVRGINEGAEERDLVLVIESTRLNPSVVSKVWEYGTGVSARVNENMKAREEVCIQMQRKWKNKIRDHECVDARLAWMKVKVGMQTWVGECLAGL